MQLPWELEQLDNYWLVSNERGRPVCRMVASPSAEEDGRRIVAAVNACGGLTVETLERARETGLKPK